MKMQTNIVLKRIYKPEPDSVTNQEKPLVTVKTRLNLFHVSDYEECTSEIMEEYGKPLTRVFTETIHRISDKLLDIPFEKFDKIMEEFRIETEKNQSLLGKYSADN